MENYEPTLVNTLEMLRRNGYVEDFNLNTDCLSCNKGEIRVHPDEFHVDHVFRFEGESDPSDEAVLYAIAAPKYALKGVLVNAYGIYSESLSNEILAKLK
jgi:Fe2+ or Zn2+ uptake regulation protein